MHNPKASVDAAYFVMFEFETLKQTAAKSFIEEIDAKLHENGSDITMSHHFTERHLCASMLYKGQLPEVDLMESMWRKLWGMNRSIFTPDQDYNNANATHPSERVKCRQAIYLGQTTLLGKNGLPFDGPHVKRFRRRNAVLSIAPNNYLAPLDVNTGVQEIDILFRTVLLGIMRNNDETAALMKIIDILPVMLAITSEIRRKLEIAYTLDRKKLNVTVPYGGTLFMKFRDLLAHTRYIDESDKDNVLKRLLKCG